MDKQEQELIAKVFDLESKGILGDLSSCPELFTQFLGFDESQVKGGISYVVESMGSDSNTATLKP
jgi:hypothetical protein